MSQKKALKLGVVMDPISGIKPYKDTTFAMLLAAQARGWSLHYMQQSDLYIAQGQPRARMCQLSVRDEPADWFTLEAPVDSPLEELDIILMRKDPPVDTAFVVATQILDLARLKGVSVANDPRSLRDCNEKLFATHFPDLCPPLLVSSDHQALKAFHKQHQDVVYKPLDGMGGRSIFRVGEHGQNLNVILETLAPAGGPPIMAQRYLPEIREGDKRILMIFGEPVPYALARIPSDSEHRGNLAAGGTGAGVPLTERDREICRTLAPELLRRGLNFVGVDVIGAYLTEINVTSPTCVRELENLYGLDIAGGYLDQLAASLVTAD